MNTEPGILATNHELEQPCGCKLVVGEPAPNSNRAIAWFRYCPAHGAGPELLAAAKAFSGRFGHSPGPFDKEMYGDTLGELRAVIGRAEGK